MENTETSGVRFENSHPILRVESMEASLRFYVDLLGFKNAEWGSEGFTCVSRDEAAIYLLPVRSGQGWGVGLDRRRGRRKAPWGVPGARSQVSSSAHELPLGDRDADRGSRRQRSALRVRARVRGSDPVGRATSSPPSSD